jgi:hypothetical protein
MNYLKVSLSLIILIINFFAFLLNPVVNQVIISFDLNSYQPIKELVYTSQNGENSFAYFDNFYDTNIKHQNFMLNLDVYVTPSNGLNGWFTLDSNYNQIEFSDHNQAFISANLAKRYNISILDTLIINSEDYVIKGFLPGLFGLNQEVNRSGNLLLSYDGSLYSSAETFLNFDLNYNDPLNQFVIEVVDFNSYSRIYSVTFISFTILYIFLHLMGLVTFFLFDSIFSDKVNVYNLEGISKIKLGWLITKYKVIPIVFINLFSSFIFLYNFESTYKTSTIKILLINFMFIFLIIGVVLVKSMNFKKGRRLS